MGATNKFLRALDLLKVVKYELFAIMSMPAERTRLKRLAALRKRVSDFISEFEEE